MDMRLSSQDLASIAALNWRAFKPDVAVEIANAWNGGRGARAIADAHALTVGQVTTAIGRMAQAGVMLRQMPHARTGIYRGRRPDGWAQDRDRRDRLERLAPFDDIAARALAELHAFSPADQESVL